MIEIELPDGTVLEFPEGTPPDVMKQAAANYVAKNPQAKNQMRTSVSPDGTSAQDRIAAAKAGDLRLSPERAGQQAAIDSRTESGMQDPGALASFMGNLAPGLTFGFADEIAATVGAPFEDRTRAEILAGLRAQQDQQMDTNPIASIAGQIAGGLASGGGIYKGGEVALKAAAPAVNAVGFPARVGLGMGAGATEGALFGAGTADGGPMGENIANMAMLGGVAGAAAPAITAGAGAAFKAIKNPILSALNIPSDVRASEAFAKIMKRAGMSQDDLELALRQASAEGQDVFKAVDALGLPGQRFLSGIARQPGDNARKEISDFLMQRQAGQGERLSGFVADALEAPDTAAARAAGMTEAARKAAKAGYGAAEAEAAPVDVRPAVGILSETIDQMSGSGMTPPRIVSEFEKLRGKLAGKTVKGEPTTLSDYSSVLALWREVKDDIDKAFRSGDGSLGEALKPVRDALEESLSTASSGFRAANAKYRSDKAAINAVKEGTAAASGRKRSEDLAAAWAKMTPEQRAAFKAGYSDPVIAKIDSSAMGTNKARALSSDKMAKDFDLLAKSPDVIRRQIGRENTMFETNATALGGSKTADNLADIQDVQGFSNSIIGNLLTGNLGMAGRQIADKVVAGATGTGPATREMIARALLSNTPAAALAPAARRAAQLEGPRKIIEALMRTGALRLGQ